MPKHRQACISKEYVQYWKVHLSRCFPLLICLFIIQFVFTPEYRLMTHTHTHIHCSSAHMHIKRRYLPHVCPMYAESTRHLCCFMIPCTIHCNKCTNVLYTLYTLYKPCVCKYECVYVCVCVCMRACVCMYFFVCLQNVSVCHRSV